MRGSLLALIMAIPLSIASGQAVPTALVVVGAGYTGNYDTEVLLSNPYDTQLEVLVGRVPLPCVLGPCPPPVPVDAVIPPRGQTAVSGFAITNGALEVSFFYVVPATDGQPGLPVVRARSFNVAQPSQAMELPAVSLAALVQRGGVPFSFPGARRSPTAHSNLIIAEVGYGPLSAHIEAIDDSGQVVASVDRSLPTGGWIFLVDILQTLGIENFSGQLRVTQTSGTGVLDGALATLTSDGGIAVSGGFNP